MLELAKLLLITNTISNSVPLNDTGISTSRSQNDMALSQFFRFAWILFILSWICISASALAQTALINDGVVSGSISAPGELDEFTFSASAGEAVHIRVVDTSGNSFAPHVWLYNPDGTLNKKTWANTTVALDCYDSSSSCPLGQTGIYRLLVEDLGHTNTGSYEIQLVRVLSSNENGTLVNDGVVSGNITVGDIDTFVFDASAGETVHIRVVDTSGNSFAPHVWLYNPDGTLNKKTWANTTVALDCYDSSSSCPLGQTGIYRLLVEGVGNTDTGNYEISFNGPPQKQVTPSPQIDIPEPSIKTNDSANIEISLDSGSEAGTNADWWLIVNTPSGLFSYDLDNGAWIPGIIVTYQEALFSLNPIDISSISKLPQGTDTVYFGVDTLMNDALDMEHLQYASVELNVHTPLETCNAPVYQNLNLADPSCEQLWNWHNYISMGPIFFDAYNKIRLDEILETYDNVRFAQSVGEIAGFALGFNKKDYYELFSVKSVGDIAKSDGATLKTLELTKMLIMLLPESISEKMPEKTVLETASILLETGQVLIDANTCVYLADCTGIVTSQFGKLVVILTGPFALIKIDEAREEQNEGLIASEFLFNYYKYGSDYLKYGESLGLPPGSTLEDYIDAIAKNYGFSNSLFGKDYNHEAAKSLINEFNSYMIEPATQACLAGKCRL